MGMDAKIYIFTNQSECDSGQNMNFSSTVSVFLIPSNYYCVSHSAVSNVLQPHQLLCPWCSRGKNTGVGCHFLLQGNYYNTVEKHVSELCHHKLTFPLCEPYVHAIMQYVFFCDWHSLFIIVFLWLHLIVVQ